MSIAEAPAHRLTIGQWHERFADYDGGRCELVCGRAIMTPTEASQNTHAIFRLTLLLGPQLQATWVLLTSTGVVTRDDSHPTVRVPDLIALRASSVGPDWAMRPRDIALVVEVVSPASVETDWVTKRGDYAAAGIPNYLIVDVRFPEGPRLWLFDRLSSGLDGRTTYDDPAGDGTTTTLRLPGLDPIIITATDLI